MSRCSMNVRSCSLMVLLTRRSSMRSASRRAVQRATRAHRLTLGTHVLVGPHAYLTGCALGDEVFVATNAMVFNGAVLGQASSVALGGSVHIGARLPPGARVPIGWTAVGDPA